MKKAVSILILIVFLIAIGVGIFAYKQNLRNSIVTINNSNSTNSSGYSNITSTQNNLSNSNSAITINNSGSTNSPAYSLVIYSNGEGVLNIAPLRYPPSSTSSTKNFSLGTFNYSALQESIESVPDIKSEGFCAKSASFGYSETVTYEGVTSGDITCPNGTAGQNLKKYVENVIAQVWPNGELH